MSARLPGAGATLALLALLAAGCGGDDDDDDAATGDAGGEATSTSDHEGDAGETGGGDPGETASLAHRFGPQTLTAFEERSPCVQWTLANEAPLYVQAVTLSNLGYHHHSNWYVVPDELYPGEDGDFDCAERGFSELAAATAGSTLFAQSTQSYAEQQRTEAGAVIKIPAGHKVVGSLHMLNVGPDEVSTELYMTLDLIHPAAVERVLSAMRMSYLDLDIPAAAESRFTGACPNLAEHYQEVTGLPLTLELHHALPHFHYLGNHFSLGVLGGPKHGEELFAVDGFSGEAMGRVFDPPLSLAGAEGLRFTCGYDNWRDVNVGWGLGDQEMCVMLGLVDSPVIIDISVTGATQAVGEQDGILEFEGPCAILMLPRSPQQGPPTPSEEANPLVVPESGDPELPPVPACVDHDPAVAPTLEPTLGNVAAAVFEPSCNFNACHGSAAAAAGLDLQAPELLAELLDHEVQGNPGASLIEPGDPEGSWLYQVLANCAPETLDAGTATHMPLNAPVLLGDPSVALVREWIAAGAPP